MAFKPPHGALGSAKNNPKNRQRSKMTQTRAEIARSTQFFSSLLDYPSNMSMWEKESLAAEAYLAAERKARKPSKKNAARAIEDAPHNRAT
jgi:hypothetical protein